MGINMGKRVLGMITSQHIFQKGYHLFKNVFFLIEFKKLMTCYNMGTKTKEILERYLTNINVAMG